ncbi:hypothetical protein [Nocardia asiatica]
MSHNIPLMRRVYEQITQHPETHDQTTWALCVAGWAVRLDGEHGLIHRHGHLADGFQAVDFRTGRIHYTEDLAAELLGMYEEEAAGLFASNNRDSVAWLEDILVAHDMREFELIAAGFTEDDWPIGEVTA